MKLIKRILVIQIFAFSLILSVTPISALDNTQDDTSDSGASAILVNEETGEKIDVDISLVDSEVKTPTTFSRMNNGIVVENTYEATAVIPEEAGSKERSQRTTITRGETDSSTSVSGKVTITYTLFDNGAYIQMTNVSGSWTINDNKVSITSRSVTYATSWGGTSVTKSPGMSYSYSTGFGKSPCLSPYQLTGATSTATIKRINVSNPSTWKFTIQNNYK